MSGINSGHSLSTTHISNFDDIRQCWIFAVLWWPFWKWRPVEICQCQGSFLDIIIYPHIKFGWHRTMFNFYHPFFMPCFGSHFENGRLLGNFEIFQYQESIRYIIIYPHIKFWWYQTMLNFCGIVAAILKIATGRNFSMSGIISWHHYLPTYQIWMTSDNVEFLPPIFYAVFW